MLELTLGLRKFRFQGPRRAKLDHELRSIWDCVTCDARVGTDLTLYNAYPFRDLENTSLPFRCYSESILHVPILKIDDAMRICEVLNDCPGDGLTEKPCRMCAFGWANFFLVAVNWMRGTVMDASLGNLQRLRNASLYPPSAPQMNKPIWRIPQTYEPLPTFAGWDLDWKDGPVKATVVTFTSTSVRVIQAGCLPSLSPTVTEQPPLFIGEGLTGYNIDIDIARSIVRWIICPGEPLLPSNDMLPSFSKSRAMLASPKADRCRIFSDGSGTSED
ncbi:predicted protein [Chaetomium globosum CBS 148.51]|uniref:Uncharacterized protein n=1 Tax=Chaetomium globosum (strain ATCC 6205 / CBS 148.51 / DSM 1962 / NBRC 6347 / NRRL 1970) TaxID=306901 RepID=Q2GMI0_CHAGB|nr:uncharacterized protein CHGG_10824 [Chaetomium globosum CBS 148.51]EAQ83006.1 predicted protein [Chaetomium globosum CBS 148.51]